MYLRILAVFTFILNGICTIAQPDTIVVYEYVHVTDTVWVEEVPPAHDIVQYSKLNSIYPELFSSESATIPEKYIFEVKNQKQLKMKRAGLLTAILLSIHSFSFAQNELIIHAGGSNRFVEHHVSTINHPVQLGFYLGPEFHHTFNESHFGYSVGSIFHLITPSFAYKQSKPIDPNLSEFEFDFAQKKTDALIELFDQYLFGSKVKIAFPLKLTYQLNKQWRTYAGVEPQISFDGDWALLTGFNIGTSYRINNHWMVNLEFSQLVTKESMIPDSKFRNGFGQINETGFYSLYSRFGIAYKL